MSEKTVADIIAEMRSDANADEYTPDGILGQKLNWLANRIDAAHKRELDELRKQVGNMAKLREACELMLLLDASEEAAENDGLSYQELIAEYADHITECQKKAKAALGAPPRNCDVGTAEEQAERFHAYCEAHKDHGAECLYCPLFGKTGGHCELVWAQHPYESEVAK